MAERWNCPRRAVTNPLCHPVEARRGSSPILISAPHGVTLRRVAVAWRAVPQRHTRVSVKVSPAAPTPITVPGARGW